MKNDWSAPTSPNSVHGMRTDLDARVRGFRFSPWEVTVMNAHIARHGLTADTCEAVAFAEVTAALGWTDAATSPAFRAQMWPKLLRSLQYRCAKLAETGICPVATAVDGEPGRVVMRYPDWVRRWAEPGWSGDTRRPTAATQEEEEEEPEERLMNTRAATPATTTTISPPLSPISPSHQSRHATPLIATGPQTRTQMPEMPQRLPGTTPSSSLDQAVQQPPERHRAPLDYESPTSQPVRHSRGQQHRDEDEEGVPPPIPPASTRPVTPPRMGTAFPADANVPPTPPPTQHKRGSSRLPRNADYHSPSSPLHPTRRGRTIYRRPRVDDVADDGDGHGATDQGDTGDSAARGLSQSYWAAREPSCADRERGRGRSHSGEQGVEGERAVRAHDGPEGFPTSQSLRYNGPAEQPGQQQQHFAGRESDNQDEVPPVTPTHTPSRHDSNPTEDRNNDQSTVGTIYYNSNRRPAEPMTPESIRRIVEDAVHAGLAELRSPGRGLSRPLASTPMPTPAPIAGPFSTAGGLQGFASEWPMRSLPAVLSPAVVVEGRQRRDNRQDQLGHVQRQQQPSPSPLQHGRAGIRSSTSQQWRRPQPAPEIQQQPQPLQDLILQLQHAHESELELTIELHEEMARPVMSATGAGARLGQHHRLASLADENEQGEQGDGGEFTRASAPLHLPSATAAEAGTVISAPRVEELLLGLYSDLQMMCGWQEEITSASRGVFHSHGHLIN